MSGSHATVACRMDDRRITLVLYVRTVLRTLFFAPQNAAYTYFTCTPTGTYLCRVRMRTQTASGKTSVQRPRGGMVNPANDGRTKVKLATITSWTQIAV